MCIYPLTHHASRYYISTTTMSNAHTHTHTQSIVCYSKRTTWKYKRSSTGDIKYSHVHHNMRYNHPSKPTGISVSTHCKRCPYYTAECKKEVSGQNICFNPNIIIYKYMCMLTYMWHAAVCVCENVQTLTSIIAISLCQVSWLLLWSPYSLFFMQQPS